MAGHLNPYAFPLFLSALVTGGLGLFILRQRRRPEALHLAVLLLAVTEWSAAYALELLGRDLPAKLLWAQMQYFGIVAIPPAWLAFTLAVTRRGRWLFATPWRLVLLGLIPLLTVLAVWLHPLQGLIWQEHVLEHSGPFLVLHIEYGWGFWVFAGYSYLLLLIGSVFLLRQAFQQHRHYRSQAIAVFIAVLAPWLGNIIYLSRLSPIPDLDLSPFAFAVSGLSLAWGIFGLRMISLTPVARSTVFENLRSAVLVLDEGDRILDLNPAATKLFAAAEQKPIGKTLSALLADWPELAAALITDPRRAMDQMVRRLEGGGERWFDLRLTPLQNGAQQWIGRLVMLVDVTDRRRAESELRRLRQAVDASGEVIFITDRQGVIRYINPAFTRLYGFAPEEVVDKVTPRILKSGRTSQEEYARLWQMLLAGQTVRQRIVNKTRDGRFLTINAAANPIRDESGEIAGFLAIQRDVSAEEEAQALLQQRLDELTLLHKVAVKGVEIADVDTLIRAATRLVGETLHPDSFGILLLESDGCLHLHSSYRIGARARRMVVPLGQGITGRVARQGRPWRVADVMQEPAYLGSNPHTRSELCVPLKAGEKILGVINVESVQVSAFNEQDERLLVTFASQLATAIERARLFAQVQQLAITDELTGIANRRRFFEQARAEFSRARRFNHPLSLIILDIDHFKGVNDRFGHPLGDRVLREVARRCQASLREVDLLGRYGGEEFAVLLPETDLANARLVAERLRAAIAASPFPTDAGPLEVTVSLGAAALAPAIPDFDALLVRADEALLAAKAEGRNRVVCR